MPVKSFHERFLLEAVESMLEQTDPDWRLLVIGEPSGLPGLRRVLTRALEDPRIELAANGGRKLAGAFNTGMRQAGTPFVAILLGDDRWEPRAVEVLGRAIADSPEVDFFHSARRVVDDDGRPVSAVLPARADVSRADFLRWSPVKHLLCWRRELGLGIGGMDESLNSVGPDDFDFPWSMADHGAAFKAIDDCLYVYRDHRTGFRLTTHLPLKHHKREIARIMAKHGAPEQAIAERVSRAEDSYLRQCLYRSRLDRLLKAGRTPAAWREPYA
jgi:glycosyltransferase involved in cell wall biosynthesis